MWSGLSGPNGARAVLWRVCVGVNVGVLLRAVARWLWLTVLLLVPVFLYIVAGACVSAWIRVFYCTQMVPRRLAGVSEARGGQTARAGGDHPGLPLQALVGGWVVGGGWLRLRRVVVGWVGLVA